VDRRWGFYGSNMLVGGRPVVRLGPGPRRRRPVSGPGPDGGCRLGFLLALAGTRSADNKKPRPWVG
jgi:hypothetical protein